MKQMPVKDLQSGMVTAADILTYDSKVAVPKGVILTENIIARLEGYSIYYVCVDDEIVDYLKQPLISSRKDLAGKESRFTRDFNRYCEHFEENVMGVLHRNEPFQAKKLLKELMQLAHLEDNSIHIFYHLLNVHSINNSFYAHCTNVAVISYVLARWLHLSEDDQRMAAVCGLFHDIGKILLPTSVFKNTYRLTAKELEIIKTHTTEGFHLLGRNRDVPEHIKNTALMHHEKCDGSGYPYGLKSNEIDRFSKIVTIANVFDNMASTRGLHSSMCPLSVIEYFENNGIQKYELKYLLVFLENMSNLHINRSITLSSGMDGNVVFIHQGNLTKSYAQEQDNSIHNMQQKYYKSIMQLSMKKNVSIETII